MKHIFVSALLATAALGFTANAAAQSSSMMTPFPLDDGGARSELAEDHAIGSVSAPITIIVYASVTCPHCSKWFIEQYPAIKRDYIETGKVRMVFRPYPTAPAQLSYAGFVIAQCSGERYMDSIEYQMNNQSDILDGMRAVNSQEGFLNEIYAYAAKSGLSSEQAFACINNNDNVLPIERARTLAQKAKVGGVPAVLMGDKTYLLEDTTFEALSEKFDAALGN